MSSTPSSHSLQLDALQKLELRSRLLSLPFHAFVHCLADLLTALGYQEVTLAGRTQWKGRNRHGGYDLDAVVPSGLGRHKVIAQVKQFAPKQRVYQRTVDELRGVALREWAGEALLLTTGQFSHALQHAAPSQVSIPVQLVDGERLLQALASHHIGVQEREGQLQVDAGYFDRLAAQYKARKRGDRRGVTPKDKEVKPQMATVILRLPMPFISLKSRA